MTPAAGQLPGSDSTGKLVFSGLILPGPVEAQAGWWGQVSCGAPRRGRWGAAVSQSHVPATACRPAWPGGDCSGWGAPEPYSRLTSESSRLPADSVEKGKISR